MRLEKTRVSILLCAATLIGLSGAAIGRPVNHHRGHAVAPADAAYSSVSDIDQRYAFMRKDWKRRHGRTTARVRRHERTTLSARRHRATTKAIRTVGSSSGNALVAEARKYLGTNPTARKSLWCGAFMDLVLRRTGHKGGGNLALGYAHYGRRVSGPQVGAIAVMRRRGGGHVGVVAGLDPNGNPIIVSGNHNHTVAVSVYPRRRIIAYVKPNS